jgi:hypothetical protein
VGQARREWSNKVARQANKPKLQTIQEKPLYYNQPHQTVSYGEICPLQYQSSSGCMETYFTKEPTGDAVELCSQHGLDYQQGCMACANHQFFAQKLQHELTDQTAIELSLDTSFILWSLVNGQQIPMCSKHMEDMHEQCPTCQQVCSIFECNVLQ